MVGGLLCLSVFWVDLQVLFSSCAGFVVSVYMSFTLELFSCVLCILGGLRCSFGLSGVVAICCIWDFCGLAVWFGFCLWCLFRFTLGWGRLLYLVLVGWFWVFGLGVWCGECGCLVW